MALWETYLSHEIRWPKTVPVRNIFLAKETLQTRFEHLMRKSRRKCTRTQTYWLCIMCHGRGENIIWHLTNWTRFLGSYMNCLHTGEFRRYAIHTRYGSSWFLVNNGSINRGRVRTSNMTGRGDFSSGLCLSTKLASGLDGPDCAISIVSSSSGSELAWLSDIMVLNSWLTSRSLARAPVRTCIHS